MIILAVMKYFLFLLFLGLGFIEQEALSGVYHTKSKIFNECGLKF